MIFELDEENTDQFLDIKKQMEETDNNRAMTRLMEFFRAFNEE